MSAEREPLLGHDGNVAGGSRRSRGRRSPSWVERPEPASRLTLSNFGPTMKQLVKDFFAPKNIKSKFPIIKWLPNYSLYDLQCDVISGLTVALTVLPQGLAYATIANLPQQYGLYSAFMGCFVYTIMGTSKDITLGPTAIMSLMTAAFGRSPVEGDATYAIILTLVCGVVQLLMGVFHLGILVNFISYPVINAFTSAAAITIAAGQVKSILGLHDIPREFMHMVYETFKKIPETNLWDLTMGIISIIILLCLKQLRKIRWSDNDGQPLPLRTKAFRKVIWLTSIAANAIIVISAAGLVAILIHFGYDNLSKVGDVKAGLPPFQPPKFSIHSGNTTVSTGQVFGDIGAGLIIVPLLGLLESIAIGKAFARQNNYKIIPNQELLAIGVANIISSFVSSYPITGSFSRTAVNSQSGVRTPAGGIVTACIILLSLQFLTPLFYYIPKSALAAVIIAAVIQMVDYEILPKFWKINKIALVPWFCTFVCSFVLGIEYGILIGIGVHLLILLYPMARPPVTFQRLFSESQDESYTQLQQEQVEYLECVVITFQGNISYPSSEHLQSKVLKGMSHEHGEAKSVVLDCTHLTASFDYTTLQSLGELLGDFNAKGVCFAMACVQPEMKKELEKAEVRGVIFADTVPEAIRKVKELTKQQESEDLEDVAVSKDNLKSSPSINRTPTNGSPQNGSPGSLGTYNPSFEYDKMGERL